MYCLAEGCDNVTDKEFLFLIDAISQNCPSWVNDVDSFLMYVSEGYESGLWSLLITRVMSIPLWKKTFGNDDYNGIRWVAGLVIDRLPISFWYKLNDYHKEKCHFDKSWFDVLASSNIISWLFTDEKQISMEVKKCLKISHIIQLPLSIR